MQSLNDDERKDVLGEVLEAELAAILKYVKEVPSIQQELHQVHAGVNEINERLTVIEHVVRSQQTDITHLQQKTA